MKQLSPAVFLDRDGTVITERKYLLDPKRMFFYPRVMPALKALKQHGYKLVIVTNQSAVARKYISLAQLNHIHRIFSYKLAKAGAKPSGIYFCPHLPDAGCACRKPKTAMLKRAARQLKIDLKRSYMVGDQSRDVEMAKRAGAKGILVLTGAGRQSLKKSKEVATKVTSNLVTAAKWILQQ